VPGTSIAIGVMAHDEGRNVGRLLERLRSVDIPDAHIRIVVVASGCTDDTVAVAERAAAADPRVTVVVDPERRGKAIAINQFIAAARDAELLVMESADTLPEPGAIAALVSRFADPRVGMVGAHPVPEDDPSTFIGFANQLLWRLHHAVASRSPKQGELVAWRNIIESLPPDSAMDEACLEQLIQQRGLGLAYAPDALVRNRGAATVGAFVLQRRRNHAGHRALATEKGYRPATRDHLLVLRLALSELAHHPSRLHWFLATAVLEVWASVLGWWDHAIAHRSHALWTMIEGTKGLARETLETYPAVGVLSVSHDHPENVLECLASVKRDPYPAKRTLVVDNGQAGAATLVREAHPDVDVLRLQNHGLASAVNAGVRALLGHGCEYVLLLNDDVVIARDFIEQAVAAAAADPRAASITGPIYYYDDPERLWYAGAEILWWLGKTYHRGRRVPWGPAFRIKRRIGYSSGAAALYPAAALRAIGDWDERYFLVFEECDWSVRASRRGWHHLYVPGPKAWHKVSASFGGEKAPMYLYFLFRNNIRFMRKFARPWHWPTFIAFFAAESVVRYSLTALVAPDRWRRERAIWLAIADAVRGRFGRGSWLPPEPAVAERRAEA
jgi:biofilm PGA synthesis N-glycosyltransferase PgaC